MDTATTYTTRSALVWPGHDERQIASYLPDNYSTIQTPAGMLIVGVDVAGWTLDGYVLPRLASGLITATEVI